MDPERKIEREGLAVARIEYRAASEQGFNLLFSLAIHLVLFVFVLILELGWEF